MVDNQYLDSKVLTGYCVASLCCHDCFYNVDTKIRCMRNKWQFTSKVDLIKCSTIFQNNQNNSRNHGDDDENHADKNQKFVIHRTRKKTKSHRLRTWYLLLVNEKGTEEGEALRHKQFGVAVEWTICNIAMPLKIFA